jgi:Protein of unknown function (DUF2867)
MNNLPENSMLYKPNLKYDYVDIYYRIVNDPKNKIFPVDVCKAFFSSAPDWVQRMMTFRNRIAAIVGLKTSSPNIDRKTILDNFKCEPGEVLGLFKIFDVNEKEVIMGEDDKHLNFRVSLFINEVLGEPNKKQITISTVVIFNNWFGKLYFLPVKPFHKLIVPLMLKGIIKNLGNNFKFI